MKISKVIEKVDKWQPNIFDLEDKLAWCYEVTREILIDNPKFMSTKKIVASDGGLIPLPEGVSFSDVAEVYINGVRREIADDRTYGDISLNRGDEVYVVYRSYPPEYELNENGEIPEILETVCPPPFDSMYIDYVCAQVAFQQNDADEYNKFISAYNTKFYSYKNVKGANSPITVKKNFVNLF